jgi:hypothetical protein
LVYQALRRFCRFLPTDALPRIGTLSFHSIAGFLWERKSLSQFFAFSTKIVNTLILELLFITENVNIKASTKTFCTYVKSFIQSLA